jgi:hypothetical protein
VQLLSTVDISTELRPRDDALYPRTSARRASGTSLRVNNGTLTNEESVHGLRAYSKVVGEAIRDALHGLQREPVTVGVRLCRLPARQPGDRTQPSVTAPTASASGAVPSSTVDGGESHEGGQ